MDTPLPRGFFTAPRWAVVVTGVGIVAAPPAADATPFVLTDQNSSIRGDTALQAVMSDWTVEGVDHLHEISNWYRVGPVGSEQSVDNLRIMSETLQDRHGDSGMDTLTVLYRDQRGRFDLEIDYGVRGSAPGTGASGLDEDVRITNTGVDPLEFHYFEYYDLDLSASPQDDTAEQVGLNAIEQSDAMTFTTWGFNTDHRFELDTFSNTLTNKLMLAGASNLGNLFGAGPLGPDNVTFAVQFDFEGPLGAPRPPESLILPGETVSIQKVGMLRQIPEPGSAALFAVAALGLRGRRRPRSC